MQLQNRKANDTYANYGSYFVAVRKDAAAFDCGNREKGVFFADVRLSALTDGVPSVLHIAQCSWKQPDFESRTLLRLTYTGAAEANLEISVMRDGIACLLTSESNSTFFFDGEIRWGEGDNAFSVNIGGKKSALRCGAGPAVSPLDNAIFDRESDSAVCFEGSPNISYDWAAGHYRSKLEGTSWKVSVKQRVYEDTFHIHYGAINKNNTFPKPPVGWMTWYAVRFDACEDIVLENARWMKEHLSAYGADTVWVDWEWYHSAFSVKGPKDITYFQPDPVRYPHGMKHVADEIRKLGQRPALWIGITNEPTDDKFIQEHPESVLANAVEWCGEYFFDLTSPLFLEERIPKAIETLKQWNYDAIKWDCLPVTLLFADRYHEYMCHPEMTSEEALRGVVERVRALMGKDYYMLSCAGAADREIRFAMDLFDGARIGGDIFNWQEFLSSFVVRVLRFYAFHNVEVYCDPDNVVLRPEFNTYHQAVSRASLAAVLGLPFTMGDHLPELPEDRVDIIKRCIPVMDAHPKDIREMDYTGKTAVFTMDIAKPFAQWMIADVFNVKEETVQEKICFEDLGLAEGSYLVYDYWKAQFMGVHEHSFEVKLEANESGVYALHRCTGVPQFVSSSRHITQGGIDLIECHYDAEQDALCGVSTVVGGDCYEVRAYDPRQEKLVVKRFYPEHSGEFAWTLNFKEET